MRVVELFLAAIVAGNAVTSNHEPRVRVIVPPSAHYVGSDRWTLFGIADCQLYAFVQADARKRVKRLYWIQFEGYLPSLPKLHHTYTSTRRATMGGLDFYIDTWAESGADRARPPDIAALATIIRAKGYRLPPGIHSGSDEQHIDALLRSKGYVLPPETVSVRLVHVLDSARKEVMIIYTEDAGPRKPTAARMREMDDALIRRAEDRITVRPYPA